MRKYYLYLVFIFLTAFSSFAQKVTLTPTSVNGSAFGGTINLGGTPYSSISLGVKVDMPTIPDNNGTVTVYVVSGLNPTIAIGGNSIPLFFGGTKSATQSLVININWGSISTLGGQLYAEYKTSGGVVYRSSSVAITKSATMSGGGNPQAPADAPNPANIANSLCCNQTIRLGDKPALINGSQYANPYQNEPYGINSLWAVNGNGSVRFNNLDPATQILDIDYVTGPGNFTITRSLGYNYSNDKPNKSNAITITVVPSPISNNEISVNGASPNTNGFIEIINTNPKSINGSRSNSLVNLNILQDPFHTPQRSDTYADIERYEWEYCKTSSGLGGTIKWTTIENESTTSLQFFNPKDLKDNEDNYYLIRRIAIYKNIKKASNTLKILLRTISYNNSICCDQILNNISPGVIESPITITGSIPIIDNETIGGTIFASTISYQWQNQPITNSENGSWSNITGATSRDYLPSPLKFVQNNRGSLTIQTTFNYRRITTITYQALKNSQLITETITSYSNEVNLTSSSLIYTSPTLTLYPNPASSTINIENKSDSFILSNARITIANTLGYIVNSNNFSMQNPNLISINISSLPIGTYFVNIENGSSRNIQLTFIKNN